MWGEHFLELDLTRYGTTASSERIEVRHHEETIAAYATQVVAEPDVLALVVVGSVARATERSTSDVDVYLVVTDEAYAAAQSAGRVAYIDTHAATYDSYVDVKLASPRYLERAVAYADDPTRASFLGARTVFDRTGSVAATIARIVTLPDTCGSDGCTPTGVRPGCTAGTSSSRPTSGTTDSCSSTRRSISAWRSAEWRWR